MHRLRYLDLMHGDVCFDAHYSSGRDIDQQFAILSHQHTIFIDGLDLKGTQIIQDDEIGDKAWRNRTTMI